MTNDILDSLEENILKASQEVLDKETGSAEYNAAVRTVTEFTKVYMELEDKEKSRMKADEDDAVKERENELKQKQQKLDNWLKISATALDVAGKVGYSLGAIYLITYGYAWEKNDRVTSQTFKTVLKDILHFRT